MVTLGRTVTLSGIRRTSPSDSLVVAWRVSSTVTSGVVGGGERVDYQVSANGVPILAATTTTKGIVRPNFSDQPSRMPGVTAGMAPFYGYRHVVECGSVPAGTIVVDAVATGWDGTTRVLQSCTIYNDSDGTDRRPSTKELFVDADTGSDSNSGADWAHALLTPNRAIDLSRANPAGSSSADRDCGGAVIHFRGDFTGGGGWSSFPWHCSGEWWLHIVCEPGTVWHRLDSPWYDNDTNQDDVAMHGNGSGTSTRLRITNCDFVGAGPVGIVGAGVTARVWLEGGKAGSDHFVDDGKASVRWADDFNDPWSFSAQVQADADNGRVICTGQVREGTVMGFGNQWMVYDCKVVGWMSNPFFVVGPQKEQSILACTAQLQRYSQGVNGVQGWVRHTGGTGFEVQVPSAGVMRILGPVGGYDFGRDAAGMSGSPRWGVGCFGFASPENNSGTPVGLTFATTNGAFPYIGNGVIGGRSYVDCANPNAVPEVGIAGAQLETAQRGLWAGGGYTDPYNQIVHTNAFSIGPDRTGHDIISDVAVFDCTGVASDVFTNGEDHHHLLLENIRGPGDGKQINMAESSITDSIIRNCSFTGPWLISHFTPGQLPALDFTGTEFVNCVFGSVSSAAPEIASLGAVVSHCHYYSGVTIGSNVTSGTPQLAGNPLVSPWSFQPAPSRIGTGHPLLHEPVEWSWSGTSETTRGCWKNVGLIGWGASDVEGEDPWESGPTPGAVLMRPPLAEVSVTTVDATFEFGPATMSPELAEVVCETVLAAISAGGVVMQPEPAECAVETVLGSVTLGPATMAPAPAEVFATTLVPQVFTVGATGQLEQLPQVPRAPARRLYDEE